MRGTVVRGFIMRMMPEEQWEEELEEATADSLETCGDAYPHYVQGEDGKFYEYYRRTAPEGEKVYIKKWVSIEWND